jgi:hypothetical protein
LVVVPDRSAIIRLVISSSWWSSSSSMVALIIFASLATWIGRRRFAGGRDPYGC